MLVEDSSSLSDLSPPRYAADLVLTIEPQVPRASIIVEVQGGIDPDEPLAWARYLATLHAQWRCATFLVVVATTREVARWGRRPITTLQPGTTAVPSCSGPTRSR